MLHENCVLMNVYPGVPYIRRELEMPAAALHHAGVRARQLEALESALKEVSTECKRIVKQ